MDVEILSEARMSQTGETLFGLMRNVLRPLDLLVRESIQNSLDAAIVKEKNEKVTVDFITGDFNSVQLSEHLGHLGSRIMEAYPGSSHRFISIRDKGTTGLTGGYDNERSNLNKLVYQIFQKQENKGAGGSCGVGKTTYLGMGIGLVLYYSRVYDRDYGYKSLLAGILVEESKRRRIITEEGSRGIAFFGRYVDPDDRTIVGGRTCPLTDESEIARVLDVFGLNQYEGEECGTTVIIPYLKGEELLDKCKPHDMECGNRFPEWTNSVEEYIEITVQRWYFARLNNRDYEGPWLEVFINNRKLVPARQRPCFDVFRNLYNHSTKDYTRDSKSGIRTLAISKKVVKKNIVGYLSWIELSPSEMKLTNEKYRDIYSLIGEYNEPDGSPILMYMRKPGMVVEYVCHDSDWIPHGIQGSEGKILIALFRLNSEAQLNEDWQKKLSTANEDLESLEDYVRSCEREDHNGWTDTAGCKIIDSIHAGVRSKLSESLASEEKRNQSNRSKTISAKLTRMLMPSPEPVTVFSPGKKKVGVRRKDGRPSLVMEYSIDSNGNAIVEFTVGFGKQEVVELELLARGESKTIDYEDWVDKIGTEYPICIESVVIDTVTESGLNLLENKVEVCDTSDVRGVRIVNKRYALQFKAQEETAIHGFMGIHNKLVLLDVDLRMRY